MTDGLKPPIKEQEPKNHAEKCPACNGFGTVGYAKKKCHGCAPWGSRGWIVVPNEPQEEVNGKAKR